MLRLCASERPAAGTRAVITAAPLRIERRDTSVGGTRAVVSSQQLMNGSPRAQPKPASAIVNLTERLKARGEEPFQPILWRREFILFASVRAEDLSSAFSDDGKRHKA